MNGGAIIKYLLEKSIYIIIINAFISILVVLFFASLVYTYKMIQIPPDGLSTKYVSFNIRTNDTNNKIKINELLDTIDELSAPFYLMKVNEKQISGIYYTNNKEISLDLISGRNMNEKDFLEEKNVILISDELVGQCIEAEGKQYYIYDNKSFEVIGVYKKRKNKINKDSVAYYNLKSGAMLLSEEMEGNYYFDCENWKEILYKNKELQNIIEINKYDEKEPFLTILNRTISVQNTSFSALILVLLMVLLNLINVNIYWVDGRKKEIAVRRVVGATSFEIIKMLLFNYIGLISFSYLIGLLVAYILSHVNMLIFSGFSFSFSTIFISYFLSILLGLITICIMLFNKDARKSLFSVRC
ncbi:ABC transporter permease [Anaeromicropila populeti]|uniref:MacB-like core domain-containing protein n=1 Tax=Anaeromicropila populeti TaxID=37658 RepID=A0A1I6LJZ8_9FIRM|nr:ABC transporter permease [Anaeromicropila populeti]SFS03642.1 MacB-like core domain-containing protein [Anaeromicropila populeti]